MKKRELNRLSLSLPDGIGQGPFEVCPLSWLPGGSLHVHSLSFSSNLSWAESIPEDPDLENVQ